MAWQQNISGLGDFISQLILAKKQRNLQEEERKTSIGSLNSFIQSMQPKDFQGGAPTGMRGVPTAPFQVPQKPTFESPGVQQALAQLLGNQGGTQLMQSWLGAKQAFTPQWESTKVTDVGWMQSEKDPWSGKLGKPELIQAEPPTSAQKNLSPTTVTETIDGKPYNVRYTHNPITGEKVGREILGEAYKSPPIPVVLQTAEGIKLLNKATGITKPVTTEGGQVEPLPPTSEMRNKQHALGLVKNSINAVKELSTRIITKTGVAQRGSAIARQIEAELGNDPEFRTYQDSRVALAGNLAVAQQGSRPSDADIKAVWLPLVPDAFRDTDESARMKWKLIEEMSLPTAPSSGEGGKTTDLKSKYGLE